MKRFLTVFLVLCLLLACSVTQVTAEDVDTSAATTNVDVVIVLDHSYQMGSWGSKEKNPSTSYFDFNGYRMDAVAMLVGMLDMDGSRVAIVPFNESPFSGNGTDVLDTLVTVDDDVKRLDLIKKVYNTNGNVRNGANIGAALMRALQILNDRTDEEKAKNRPMIILLSNGLNYGPGKVREDLRWNGTTITDNGVHTYKGIDELDKLTREAVECAKKLDIPIYTVSMQDKNIKNDNGYGYSMADISKLTKLKNGSFEVKAGKATELPEFFSYVLADRIGSSVHLAEPKPVENEKNTYEVYIPILNSSVHEANIIIPIKIDDKKNNQRKDISAIDSSKFKVYNGDESIGIADGWQTLKDPRGSFAIVKIRKPQSTGIWRLRFESETKPSDDIHFNVLYNYDLKLSATVTAAGGVTSDFYKNEKLNLKAFFITGNGEKCEDSALYTDYSGQPGYEEWTTIRATWGMYPADENGNLLSETPVREGTMDADPVSKLFEAKADFSSNPPKSGNYLVIIHAAGAGLDRQVEIPIKLKNHEPVSHDYIDTIYVNRISTKLSEEERQASWTVPGTSGELKEIAPQNAVDGAELIIYDPDGDELNYSVLRVEEGQREEEQAAVLDHDPNTGKIKYHTKQGENNGVKGGTASYYLDYNDNDGGSGTIKIVLTVFSERDDLIKAYEPEIKLYDPRPDPNNETYSFMKNAPLKVSVRLKEKNGSVYAPPELISAIDGKLTITDTMRNENLVNSIPMEPNGDALEYTLESTGNKETELQISVNVFPWEQAYVKTANVPNANSPKKTNTATDAETQELTINCDGKRVPGFLQLLPIIGKETPDLNDETLPEDKEEAEKRLVIAAPLFTDDDGDILTYDAPVFVKPGTDEKMDDTAIHADEADEENTWVIRVDGSSTGLFHYFFNSEMHLTVRDGDGKEETYTRTITVVDLYNKMLTYLAILGIAILALIILALIIHQIRKPVFPVLKVTIREEPSLFVTSSANLSPVKSWMDMNRIGVDSDLAAKHNVSMEYLQNIILRPLRSKTAIGFRVKKPIPGHEVLLDDVIMKPKKWHDWRVGQEVGIRCTGGEGMIALKLDLPDGDGDDPGQDMFDDTGDWSDVNEFSAMTTSSTKRGRKVKNQPAPAEEESFTGGSDDFDF